MYRYVYLSTSISLLLLSLLTILFSLHIGPASISFNEILQMLHLKPHIQPLISSLDQRIVLDIRLPRTLNAFCCGALLSLAGAMMQALLRNPLADPYVLGISGGAAVGTLIGILLGIAAHWTMLGAFAGSLLSIFLVFNLSRDRSYWSTNRLLLTGVVVAMGWSAIISLILSISPNHDLHTMLFWLMGSIDSKHLAVPELSILTIGFLLSFIMAPQLNVFIQGELPAKTLGVNTFKLKFQLFAISSLLTACAVTIAGNIGFVGLVVPHMLRLIGIRDHRFLLPLSALLGGCLLTLSDSIARMIVSPAQLPVGIITALIGIPVFLLLLKKSCLKLTT